jgi:hypothetical protein
MDPGNGLNGQKSPPAWLLIAAALLLAAGLLWFEQLWPSTPGANGASIGLSPDAPAGSSTPPFHAAREALKLVFAGVIGALVSAIHRRHPGDKPISRSLGQAQILLCVAGALMMIIIGNSLARALGIAGGATIVRFRTPVEDAKDSTVLFLLLGLGMACGLGEFGVAGLGTAFLCICLPLLDRIVARKPRAMMLEMASSGPEFPAEYVNRLLAAYQVRFESREVNQHNQKTTVRYHCTLDPDTPLQRLSEQLTDPQVGGLKAVSWETLKKE